MKSTKQTERQEQTEHRGEEDRELGGGRADEGSRNEEEGRLDNAKKMSRNNFANCRVENRQCSQSVSDCAFVLNYASGFFVLTRPSQLYGKKGLKPLQDFSEWVTTYSRFPTDDPGIHMTHSWMTHAIYDDPTSPLQKDPLIV